LSSRIHETKGNSIKTWINEHKLITAASIFVFVLVTLVIYFSIVNWLFGMKINGTWMIGKAGVNIWDLYFEQGYYWKMLWIVPTLWILSDPFFWRKRFTMKLLFRVFDKDINEKGSTTFTQRFVVGLALMLFRGFIGFIIALLSTHEIAKQFLIIDNSLNAQGTTWASFIREKYFGTIYYWFRGGLPTGSYLIENTIVFEFMTLLATLLLPILAYWSIKLVGDGLYEARKQGNVALAIANVVTLLFLWQVYVGILMLPNNVVDISAKIYVPWNFFSTAVLGFMTIALKIAVQVEQLKLKVNRHSVITMITAAIVLAIIIIWPMAQATYVYSIQNKYDANLSTFEFPYKKSPHIAYIKWTNDLNGIQTLPVDSITTPPQFEEEILKNVRVISYTAAINIMKNWYGRYVGQPWMKVSLETLGDGKTVYGPMIVWANGHEYWVDTTSPVLVESAAVRDTDAAKQYLYTHSEVITVIDAASGEIVPLNRVYPQIDNSTLSMYYGIGGLFRDQDVIYLYMNRYNSQWDEIHLPTYKGSSSYDGAPDYIFGNDPMPLLPSINERQWYFGWKGTEWWSFGDGKYGTEISVLMKKDVVERVNSLLLDGLQLETEPSTETPIPYLVVDGTGNVYLAFAVYINRPLNTDYTDTKTLGINVETSGNFRRLFAMLLVNLHDGTIDGYRYGDWDENYITQYFASYYPAWNKEIPSWVTEQIRYPKSLMLDTMDLYNTYHLDSNDWQNWYPTLNFYDFPTDIDTQYFSNQIEDTRYIPVYFQGALPYAGVRLVELYKESQEKGQYTPRNIVGMYMFLGNGQRYFITLEKLLPFQQIIDAVKSNRDIQYILTTTQQRGQPWEQGNILMYVIGGRPVFFIPYYSIQATVTQVTLIVAVDAKANSEGAVNVGYYQLSASPSPEEVRLAVIRAYTSVTKGLLLAEEQRTDLIKTLIQQNGINIVTPQIVNPMIGQVYASVDFKVTQESTVVNATLAKFVEEILKPYEISTVYIWTTTVGPSKVLHVGALLPNFVMVIVDITIT